MPSLASARAAAAVRAVTAAGLAASALALPAAAHADTPGPSAGSARAVTAELDLHVSLLDKAVDVPVNITLNKVQTPAERDGSVLTAKVDGVDRGRPVTLVKAEAGKSVTHVDARGTSASVTLAGADLHVPGLSGLTLLGLEALTAEVTCPVDGQPTAKVSSPVRLTVLGRPVTVGLNSPTRVVVPAVGTVEVEFSRRNVTSATAAASALELSVDVNPLNLNVARVTGRVTVASVSCEKPAPSRVVQTTSAAPSTTAANRPAPPKEAPVLAATGSTGTGTLLAGAAALLVAGGAVTWTTRRRRARARHR
ncbi:LPXTG cell wall anchor domain-containing protein [Kitasatospora sp. NE20-6]|uniref:SCO1860 family LAETG-anchored protein n=1 Tax=Kitasatospora sp. NE20-6 TaxID=2859066 RepID=UPI0034DC3727